MRHSVLIALTTLVLSAPVMAEKADSEKPIELSADRGSLDQKKGVTVWEGNVVVVQGTLNLKAQRVTVTRDAQGNQQLQAQGSPVTFRQKVDGSNEYVEGSASNVNYNTAANLATLTGNARVKRGQDSVSGAVIVYNTATETYQASGGSTASGNSGRVTVILQPKAQGTP